MHPITKASLVALVALATSHCGPMSEKVDDRDLGFNGGFEHVRDGLPVNWLVYSPRTVPEGDFELVLDEAERKEGQRSLAFHVESCSPGGGWRSPGIAKECPIEPGGEYELGFWIRSRGCSWVVSYGAVDAKTGRSEKVSSSEVEGSEWQHVTRRFPIPENYRRLRLELSIRSPGDLWIDDVRVTPVGELSR